MRKTFLAFLAPALALTLVQGAHATANYVYHQRVSSQILQSNGGTPPSSCGSYLDRVYVAAGQTNTVQFKIEFQFYTNAAQLYYTTDGTTPSGQFGTAASGSTKLTTPYTCTFTNNDSNTVDVVTGTLPAQTAGKVVKYIASAYNTGGGDDIFANGCGNCGSPNNTPASAQVFSYTVEGVSTTTAPAFTLPSAPAGAADTLNVTVVPGTSTDQNGTTTDTVTSVKADLSSIGGSSTATLSNGGSGNAYAITGAINALTVPGAKTIPVTVTFGSGNTATANATLTVTANNFRTVYPRTALIQNAATPIAAGNLRGFGINANPASPYYGYLYLTDTSSIHSVHIYAPVPAALGPKAPNYADTGFTIVSGATASANPHDVFVGPDDTVWLADFSDHQVLYAPAVPPTGTSVNGIVAFTSASIAPRGVWVTGSLATGANVYVSGNAGAPYINGFEVWNVTAASQVSAPTAATKYTTFTATHNLLRVTVDGNGNVYGGKGASVTNGNSLVDKYVPSVNPPAAGMTFTTNATYLPKLPAFLGATTPVGVAYIPNANAVGGGYLVVSGYNTTLAARFALDSTGTYLDAFGNSANSSGSLTVPAGGSYTIQPLSGPGGNQFVYDAVDNLGQIYVVAITGGAAPSITRVTPAGAYYAGAATKSSPTAIAGTVYFGDDAGKLHGQAASGAGEVGSFPATLSATSTVRSRPAARYLQTGVGAYESAPTLFTTTSDGKVFAHSTSGVQRWAATIPLAAFTSGFTAVTTSSTPAVYYNATAGANYAYLGATASQTTSGTTTSETRVLMFDAATGTYIGASPVLTTYTSTTGAVAQLTSPAIYGNYLYVGANNITTGGTAFALHSDLTVQTMTTTAGGTNGSPFVRDSRMYIGTNDGTVYAINAFTGAFDPNFGANATAGATGGTGFVTINSLNTATPISINTDIFVTNDKVYVTDGFGGTKNNFYYLNASDGSGPGTTVGGSTNTYLLFQTPTSGAFNGVAIDTAGNGGLGVLYSGNQQTSDGSFWQIALNAPTTSYRQYYLGNSYNTLPTIDTTTGQVFIGSNDGNIYRFPRQ